MGTSAQNQLPRPAAPRKSSSFNRRKFFTDHRPSYLPFNSPLPMQCSAMGDTRGKANDCFTASIRRTLAKLNLLVPEADRYGASGKPMVTGRAGYARLGRMTIYGTKSSFATEQRNIRWLIEYHFISAWDVAYGRTANSSTRTGRPKGAGGRRESRYVIHRYADVRSWLEQNPDVGRVVDPQSGIPQFFKYSHGRALLSPDEVKDWHCEEYIAAKREHEAAEDRERESEKITSGPVLVQQSTPAEPTPEINALFRQASRTLNDADISGMYSDAVKIAGPLSAADVRELLAAVIASQGHTKGFKYLAKTFRDKVTGFSQTRAAEKQKASQRETSQRDALMQMLVDYWLKVLDHSTRPDDAKWYRDELKGFSADDVAEAREIARRRLA